MLISGFTGPLTLIPIKKSSIVRQHDEVAKRDSAQKQKHRRNDEARHRVALVLVKSRRDEQPNLIEHPRHREHDSQVQPQVNDQADVAGGAGVVKLVVEVMRRSAFCIGLTMKSMK